MSSMSTMNNLWNMNLISWTSTAIVVRKTIVSWPPYSSSSLPGADVCSSMIRFRVVFAEPLQERRTLRVVAARRVALQVSGSFIYIDSYLRWINQLRHFRSEKNCKFLLIYSDNERF
ncbi:uncharacterized protein [Polyergus mexicanus]|uniref:uncharacterized protein n=1 Tax=Polyergus mexicanus TaxID=615972 RepID=UPI0038B4D084